MFQNGQALFKNLEAFAARFLKCLIILGHYALKGSGNGTGISWEFDKT